MSNIQKLKDKIEYCTSQIKKNPTSSLYFNNRGFAYDSLKQFQNAIDDYTSAIKIKPDFAEAYNNRGFAYDSLKQFQNAIDDYTSAIKIKPDYHNAYNNRGSAYDSLKQFQNAIDDNTSAIKIKPDYATAYYNRGSAYDSLKQFQNAIDDYTSAIKIKPDYATAYYNRGSAYDSLKQFQNAIDDYTSAIKIKPDYATAYNNRGSAYHGLKQFQNAIDDYTSAIKIRPDYTLAYNNRESAYKALKQFKNTIEKVNIVSNQTESIFETEVQLLKKKTTTKIDYKKLKMLGKGGVGKVFKAMNKTSGKIIAVKEITKSGKLLSVLSINEKNLMMNLNHPNVIDILGFEETNDSFIIITSYAGEGTILDFFNENFGTDIKDKCIAAKVYFKQIIEGLHYLHISKVFHRDIKPSNILVDRGIIKIADFGTSKKFDNVFTNVTSIGTFPYFSPEFMKSEVMDIKVSPIAIDIWALGITFIEILTGKYPFPTDNGVNLKKIIWNLKESPSIPSEITDTNLRQLIQSCLIIDQSKRTDTQKLLDHQFFK